MKVLINGQEREIPQPCTVSELVEHLRLGLRGVAVEINRQIIPRSEFETRSLADADQVEILRMVGGG